MRKRMFLLSALVLMVAGGIFWSCQQNNVVPNPEGLTLKSATIAPPNYLSWCAAPSAFQLIAGQTINAGNLLVSNDGSYLRVEYVAKTGFNLGTVHLWVGTDPTKVPKNKQGIPVPGQFPYKGDAATGYVFYLPLPTGFDCKTTTLYIYAHAEVNYMVAGITKTETAWSEGTTFGTSRWGWYSSYKPCCATTVVSTGLTCTAWQTETAYGGINAGQGAAWWYYYDGVGNQTIWAGQNINIGTVELLNQHIIISLTNGWELNPESLNETAGVVTVNNEPVKIQGYTSLPSKRPASGLFDTYKGTSLNPEVGSFPYYVIHLDVRKCTKW